MTMIDRRDMHILCCRYGIRTDDKKADPMSLAEIGERFYIHRERVRQILVRVEQNLRLVALGKATMEVTRLKPMPPVITSSEELRATLDREIEWLRLPTRINNILRRGGIRFVGQLVRATVENAYDLLRLEGLGYRSFDDIAQAVDALRLPHWREEIWEWTPERAQRAPSATAPMGR